MSVRYCPDEGEEHDYAILRAYLPKSKAIHFFMDKVDINAVLQKPEFLSHRATHNGDKFLLAGPEAAGGTMHEMVISQSLLPDLVFIPSSHRVTHLHGGKKILLPSSSEREAVSIDITDRREF